MKKFLVICAVVLAVCGCDNLFWNDELDYQWRLDKIEYVNGQDLAGNDMSVEEKTCCWLSMARDLAVFEDLSDSAAIVRIMCRFEYDGDSITFDFTANSRQESLARLLPHFGLPGTVSSFSMHSLERNSMVMAGDSTVLYFTRW